MHSNHSAKINPYAPATSEFDGQERVSHAFPVSGIHFVGVLDLRLARNTRKVSVTIGSIFAVSFIGVLMSAAVTLASEAAIVILGFAAGLTALALWGFVHGQTDRPLIRFDWMQGPLEGRLGEKRLDIRWCDGESEASFAFPSWSSDLDFSNHYGRLFVIRNIPCFIPKRSVSAADWRHIQTMRPQEEMHRDQVDFLRPPVRPSRDAAWVWPPAEHSFSSDVEKHKLVCAAPRFSRLLFLSSIMMLALVVGTLQPLPNRWATLIALSIIAICSGLFWLAAELGRRGWLSPVGAVGRRRSSQPAPTYDRWIDLHRLLVGYHDAWICVPWAAVQKATVSPHAVQFSLTPLGLDAWFLERGAFTEQQWQAIIGQVRSRAPKVSMWGAVRRSPRKRASNDG
jgi:hypothetical protein